MNRIYWIRLTEKLFNMIWNKYSKNSLIMKWSKALLRHKIMIALLSAMQVKHPNRTAPQNWSSNSNSYFIHKLPTPILNWKNLYCSQKQRKSRLQRNHWHPRRLCLSPRSFPQIRLEFLNHKSKWSKNGLHLRVLILLKSTRRKKSLCNHRALLLRALPQLNLWEQVAKTNNQILRSIVTKITALLTF